MESILLRSSELLSLRKKKKAQYLPFCCFTTASHPYRKGGSVALVSALAIGWLHAQWTSCTIIQIWTWHIDQSPALDLCLQGLCLSSANMNPICSTKAARGQGVHPTPQCCRISLLSPPFPAVQWEEGLRYSRSTSYRELITWPQHNRRSVSSEMSPLLLDFA